MAGGDSGRPVTEGLGSVELQLHFGGVSPGKYLFKCFRFSELRMGILPIAFSICFSSLCVLKWQFNPSASFSCTLNSPKYYLEGKKSENFLI